MRKLSGASSNDHATIRDEISAIKSARSFKIMLRCNMLLIAFIVNKFNGICIRCKFDRVRFS